MLFIQQTTFLNFKKEVLQHDKQFSSLAVVTDALHLLPNAYLLQQNVTLYICLKGEI